SRRGSPPVRRGCCARSTAPGFCRRATWPRRGGRGRAGPRKAAGGRRGVALAVRAPRLGHVHVDLSSIRDTAAVESENPVDLESLPWPEVEPWLAAVATSPLVANAAAADRTRPLRLDGAWLYLDR